MGSDQRWPLRVYNASQRILARLGKEKRGLANSETVLHDAAAAAAGSNDFGDAGYLPALRVLLEAYDTESRLTPFGRMMVEQQIVSILKNRAVARRSWRERPEILDGEVERPIFILGLPRTGTTALHHLLGADPRNQALEYFLAAAPKPRPRREAWAKDADFKRARRDLAMTYWLDPDLKSIHLMTADGPEECRHLLQQSFTDDTFDCNATIPSYTAWYGACDMRPSYEHHRNLLRLVGATTPERRWLLKYPAHMAHMDALLNAYPDACFVQTHRDPARVLPSICSLVAGWRGIYEDRVDRPAIATWLLELWAERLDGLLAVRERLEPARFFDISFREVVADPVRVIGRLYDHFGIERNEAAERVIADHAAANPRGKHGEHRYSAADFDLNADAMHERFGSYLDHFDIEREALP